MFSDQRLKSESHLLTNDASKGWTNSTTWEGSNRKSQFGIPNVANVGPAEPAGSALVCVLTRDREPSMVQEYLPFSSSLICQIKSNEFCVSSSSFKQMRFGLCTYQGAFLDSEIIKSNELCAFPA